MGGTLLKVNITTNGNDGGDLNIRGQATLVGGTLLKVQVVATFCPTAYLSAIHFLLIIPLICLVKTLKRAMSISAASVFSRSASPTLRRWSWPGIHWSAQRWLIRASSSSHTFKERETSSVVTFLWHRWITAIFLSYHLPHVQGTRLALHLGQKDKGRTLVNSRFGLLWLNYDKTIWSQRWYYCLS